jgi:hypothetical protein
MRRMRPDDDTNHRNDSAIDEDCRCARRQVGSVSVRAMPGLGIRPRRRIKVHGQWRFLYRAIDRSGALIDVMFSEHRGMAAAMCYDFGAL